MLPFVHNGLTEFLCLGYDSKLSQPSLSILGAQVELLISSTQVILPQ